jgi:hypothetical protein
MTPSKMSANGTVLAGRATVLQQAGVRRRTRTGQEPDVTAPIFWSARAPVHYRPVTQQWRGPVVSDHRGDEMIDS